MKKKTTDKKPKQEQAMNLNSWSGDNVIMSNSLVNGIHRLELNGKRVTALAMSQVENKKNFKMNADSISVEMYATEFSKIFNLEKSDVYISMKRGANELLKSHVSLDLKDTQNNIIGLKKINWTQSIEYFENEGRIKVEFNRLLTPHITRLIEQQKYSGYTLYKIEQAGKLKSVYAWRLFELFSQFRDTGWMIVSVDELQNRLEATSSMIGNFAKFKNNCLAPALLELREKCKLNVVMNATKEGRKYTKIKFTFKDEKPTEVNDKAQEDQSIWKADRLEEDSSQEPQTTESSDIYDYDFFGNGEPKEPTRLT
jgi:plasmid replication initiation protein